MIHEQVTLDDTIAFLNSLIKVDEGAVNRLIASRVPCSRDLSMHPTVQCGENEVGMLGILNGLFGVYGPEAGKKEMYGPITAHLDGGKLVKFSRTVPVEQAKAGEAQA